MAHTILHRLSRPITPQFSPPKVILRPHTIRVPTLTLSQHLRRPSSHSHSPHGTSSPPSRAPVTLSTISSLHTRRIPITMLTASSFPSASLASHSLIDIILTGDSLAMVTLGLTDTSALTLDEMLIFARAVSRGAQGGSSFLVGDLPMGSYEISPSQAVESAIRMIKEGRQQAVKLEGGIALAPTIQRITSTAGIPVMAHIGLTPQRQHSLSGFRVQGKTTLSALNLLRDALAVQAAGAFAVVLEAVPEEIARIITKKLDIPTIGIGAGNGTSGQVLVQADMLGDYPPGRSVPRFVKRYGDVWREGSTAVGRFREEVRKGEYPSKEHTYPMERKEVEEFERLVEREGG